MGKHFNYDEGIDLDPIRLTFSGVDYYAAPVAPGGTVFDLADVSKIEDQKEKLDVIERFFSSVLLPDSAELFAKNLRDPSAPIGFKQLVKAFEDLIDEYTGEAETERPTSDPSSSDDGSSTTGSSSTQPAPSAPVDSTPEPLPLPES